MGRLKFDHTWKALLRFNYPYDGEPATRSGMRLEFSAGAGAAASGSSAPRLRPMMR